ncbi:MAG: ribosome-associated translation inhibitor RaiA [Rickettsiales bacterium]|jgi:ribosomal subunit interface protein|nr:ribosome-associated translation inhibitor RaiA [Rickettsiales bacterium]
MMTIQVEGQGFDVGESLSAKVENTIKSAAARHGLKILASNVVFTAAPHKKAAASVMLRVKGHEFFASKTARDAYGAFAEAFDDVEKQVAKEKTRTKAIERKKQ